MNIRKQLDQLVTRALSRCISNEAPGMVRQAGRPEFGHYQANGVMAAAKKQRQKPRQLAEALQQSLAATPIVEMAEKLEVAGPGFINIHLSSRYIATCLGHLRDDPRLHIPRQAPETIVVDYSSPNLAKEMHVGHIRSTIIGDTLVRMLEFQGHRVQRANHVGDWGAQFGSLLAQLDDLGQDSKGLALQDLETFYQEASRRFREEPDFTQRARRLVYRLQQGDAHCLELWQHFVEESARHCQAIYDRLGVTLTLADMKGESFYRNLLPKVMEELDAKGLLTLSDGAACVFLPEFTGKEGRPLPAMIQKSDGSYPYMATDLAAIRYRVQQLHAKRALYVVGAPQGLHLQQLFAVAKAAGYLQADGDFRHLAFGSITNEDRIPFKTRAGSTVKLAAVLEEAEARAMDLVTEKNPQLSEELRLKVARAVSIGAVKYAELSKNRNSDYVFSWDQMLSFEGNTAPYLMYAATRIRSIFRRSGAAPAELTSAILLQAPEEISLAIKLLQFPEAFDAVLEDYHPNLLCSYLFELAGRFMSFYETCPVLKAEEPARDSRLLLCHLTARTLEQGLAFLGIDIPEQM